MFFFDFFHKRPHPYSHGKYKTLKLKNLTTFTIIQKLHTRFMRWTVRNFGFNQRLQIFILMERLLLDQSTQTSPAGE